MTVNQTKSAPSTVKRMLVGELNSRVRRNPMKPVVLIGAGRSETSASRTKDEAAMSLMLQGSGRDAIRRHS